MTDDVPCPRQIATTLEAIHRRLDALEDQIARIEGLQRPSAGFGDQSGMIDILRPVDTTGLRAENTVPEGDETAPAQPADAKGDARSPMPLVAGAGLMAAALLAVQMTE